MKEDKGTNYARNYRRRSEELEFYLCPYLYNNQNTCAQIVAQRLHSKYQTRKALSPTFVMTQPDLPNL